ncbi:MAG: hypothetical protein ACP5PQ_05865 [Thermoproteota archaeon]
MGSTGFNQHGSPLCFREAQHTTTVTREITYYDVYNATWRLLYHHYKHFVYSFHEYLANGNVSSSDNWVFDRIGDSDGEVCDSAYLGDPSSLRIASVSRETGVKITRFIREDEEFTYFFTTFDSKGNERRREDEDD